ncbi:MAG: FKBP-type peptidyl-prolyl cis-trans isomerase [Bacteroidales bacterium]|nr:FKBP-type peptidyl-prolyl cis-trans isomerase [Bacteroidales bacterium]
MRKLLYALPLAVCVSCNGGGTQFVQNEDLYGDMGVCFVEQHQDSIKAKPGDVIFLDMDYFLEDGRKVYSSRDVSDNFRMYAPQDSTKGTINQALMMMHKGDSALFRVKAGPFMASSGVKIKNIADDDPLVFRIRMKDIYDGTEYQKQIDEYNERMEAQEKMILRDYVRNENIKEKPSESGLYRIVTQPGSGTETAAGKKVTVHFVGSLVDGSEFDNSYKRGQPFTFQLGVGKSIPGFEEGISQMRKGEKCRLIFPSSLGYGSRGVGGRIAPFSTLIFDIELIDFE